MRKIGRCGVQMARAVQHLYLKASLAIILFNLAYQVHIDFFLSPGASRTTVRLRILFCCLRIDGKIEFCQYLFVKLPTNFKHYNQLLFNRV